MVSGNDTDHFVTKTQFGRFLDLLARDAITVQTLMETAQAEDLRLFRDDIRNRFGDFLDGGDTTSEGSSGEDLVRTVLEMLVRAAAPPKLQLDKFDIDLGILLAKSREIGGGVEVSPLNIGYHVRYGTRYETSSRVRIEIEPVPSISAKEPFSHGG